MKGTRPGQAFRQRRGLVAHDPRRYALDTLGHLRGGPSREGHQQDTTRVGPLDDQVRDAVRQRVGLAGSGSGDDQQRPSDLPIPIFDRGTLFGIEDS